MTNQKEKDPMGKTISAGSGVDAFTGYLASAQDEAAPGIVVIQEWWGVQDQIRGVCERYAAAGFHALAPDLYAGTVVPYHDMEAAAREMDALDFLSATDRTVRAAARYLDADKRRLGLSGYCLGGIVSILGAIRLPEFSASVCFYGLPSPDMGAPGDVRIPVQGHFADGDDWCMPEHVDVFEAGMREAGKSFDCHRYAADHGFCNEDAAEYDRQLADLAWKRTLAFWRTHLVG
jgi:carboxymethylenebutenolidase